MVVFLINVHKYVLFVSYLIEKNLLLCKIEQFTDITLLFKWQLCNAGANK